VDADTQEVTHRLHLPYGGARGEPAVNWPGERDFVGGTRDATGLTHLGAREYDTSTGRFLSVDPVIDVEDPQQMNGYAYGNDNPASFSDPDGLKAKKKAKKPKAKTKTTAPKCGNPRQCDGSNAQIAKDVKKMKKRAAAAQKRQTAAQKRYCANPRQCDQKDVKKVTARNAAQKRKCGNPRQCDGSNAKIAKDVAKMKKRAAAKSLGDAADAATTAGALASGADKYDTAADKWKKEWWASKHAGIYKKQPPLNKPAVKWGGRGLGAVGAAMTFNSAVANGDSLGKAVAKTGVDWAAVWLGTEAGAAVGGAIGSVVPVLGTAAGAFIGAIVGTGVGMLASKGATEWIDSKFD
jgi:RHS repeat-associated protein